MSPLSTPSLSLLFSASQADCVADRSFGGCSLPCNEVPKNGWELCDPHLGVGFELRAHDCKEHQYPAEDHQESHPELVDEGVEPVVRVCDRIFGCPSTTRGETPTPPPRRAFPPVRKATFSPSGDVIKGLAVSRVKKHERRLGVMFVDTHGNSVASRRSRVTHLLLKKRASPSGSACPAASIITDWREINVNPRQHHKGVAWRGRAQ